MIRPTNAPSRGRRNGLNIPANIRGPAESHNNTIIQPGMPNGSFPRRQIPDGMGKNTTNKMGPAINNATLVARRRWEGSSILSSYLIRLAKLQLIGLTKYLG